MRRWCVCLFVVAALLVGRATLTQALAARPIEIKFYCGETEVTQISICKGCSVNVTIDVYDCDLNESEDCCPDEVNISEWDFPCDRPPRVQSGEHEGHYRTTCSITCDSLESQELDVRADDLEACRNSWNEPLEPNEPEASARLTVSCVEVTEISILNNSAADITADPKPEKTNACAAVKGTGDVLLEAVGGNSSPCAGCDITWSGGEAVTGQPRQRKVSKSSWKKETVTANCGNTSATMLVYIIWAEPTGFSPADGVYGVGFADNEARFPDGTGLFGPVLQTGTFYSQCEMQFTVRPDELIADGNAELLKKEDIFWDVSRLRQRREWTRTGSTWANTWLQQVVVWGRDDDASTDEDNNPWNGNGHVYGTDGPGRVEPLPWEYTGYNLRWNMLEFVRVGLDVVPPVEEADKDPWPMCSDYLDWRAFRSVRDMNGWEPDEAYENMVAQGNVLWGAVPVLPDCGSIHGLVKDRYGIAIEGASVVADTGSPSATTNSAGYYLLPDLYAGDRHTVTASKTGYVTESCPGIIIFAGGPLSWPFVLSPEP